MSVYGELQLEWVRLVRERIDKRPLASLSANHFIFSRNRSLKNWSAPIHSFSLSFFLSFRRRLKERLNEALTYFILRACSVDCGVVWSQL